MSHLSDSIKSAVMVTLSQFGHNLLSLTAVVLSHFSNVLNFFVCFASVKLFESLLCIHLFELILTESFKNCSTF